MLVRDKVRTLFDRNIFDPNTFVCVDKILAGHTGKIVRIDLEDEICHVQLKGKSTLHSVAFDVFDDMYEIY